MRIISALAIGAGLLIAQTNSIGSAYDQPYRPQYHFSPREHWTNDPNGLVYFEGEYHLFFQYNPFGDQWGHMTWGHAVSRDLVHWEQLPPAIREDGGIMIFTGSSVVDEHNSSGLCANGKPCLVAIYTGHTPAGPGHAALQTQNIAVSNDRGGTWTKYAGNPVLNLHMADFRDPHVFWTGSTKQWTMAVALPNEHKVRFYGSKDLKHWAALSDFGPAGATDGQWECPQLIRLPVEDAPGETRWILKIGLNPGSPQGGSGEQYFVGRFDGQRFINDNPPAQTMWTDYGKDCYCALIFNDLPTGEHPVMMGWMDNWQYAKDLPSSPWRGQMTFPRTLKLVKTPAGIRLQQTPVDKIRLLESEGASARHTGTMASVNSWLAKSDLKTARSYQLHAEIPLRTAREVGWRILMSGSHFTLIGYNVAGRKLFFDRSQSGLTSFSKDFPDRTQAPLILTTPTLRLDVLVDRSSVEIFADGGLVASTNLVFPEAGAAGLEIYAKGGETGPISVELSRVQSIWK
ncbi:MAG TPA: glycoside hydrolase family 32 protein [Bryobacteraceae bacterium]|jgi:sucrose-6-phosphate hydrolase SacC (GH32 family)|nr:glycoside hydrolase family 32 protein [Bryobacteraceae bacterium]